MRARPESPLVSRRARATEAALLADLAARTFADAFGSQNDPRDMDAYVGEAFSAERIAAELAEPGSLFLLGFDPTRDPVAPVGYCRLLGESREPGIEGPDPVELQRLYVDGSVRGAGYGSALLWDALERARGAGYRTIWLGVWEDNLGAQRFYRRWGFEVVGTHEFTLGSDRQTDLLMSRALG